MQIVVFQLGGEKYAIETNIVQGIEKTMNITRVPRAANYIKGLINLRGSVISVIDPYAILGVTDKPQTPENIIIIETESEILGIIVDKVVEVEEIDEDSVKNIAVSREDERSYIKGTINMGDYIITMINIDALLSVEA